MNGILIVDKPQGMSSHAVIGRVRRLFGLRKVGHAGTLDPLATGVLVVALGQGTRILQFLMEKEKVYRASMQLGVTTDSQDCEGNVLAEHAFEHLDKDQIEQACLSMIGTYDQVPPMYSALKKDGVPLYKLARMGIEVERQARKVTIHTLEPTSLEPPFVSFDTRCSKGTYIRTLCHDIGMRLGCGAHLTALRRLRSGTFSVDDAVTLEEIENTPAERRSALLLSIGDALKEYPALIVDPQGIARLAHGIPPTVDMLCDAELPDPGCTVLLSANGQALAVARFAPERINESRGDFELLRVFNTE